MSSRVSSFRNKLEQQKGRRDQLAERMQVSKKALGLKRRELRRTEQAREVIREVGLATQQQLQYHISDITSLALGAVFNNPYALQAEFVQRRNKTECDLYFERDGFKADPLSASGGGAVDVAAFALRVACWSMQSPRSSPILILDEPFRYLSEGLRPRASEMLKEISEKLGLQIIMVTHFDELMEAADNVVKVKMSRGKSLVS